jgi:hypothetical protein
MVDSWAESVNVSLALEPHLESDATALNTGVQAVHFSLDGHPLVKVNGSTVVLRGLAAGAHTLHMKGENAVGSVERIGQTLSWGTSPHGAFEAYCLLITPRPTQSSSFVAFDVSGSCSDHYKWRLDGSAWVEAINMRQHEFSMSDDSAAHYWEAFPVANGDLWTRPPLVHFWSKSTPGTTTALGGMAVNIGTFLDGHHNLTVKAIDAAGKIEYYHSIHSLF